MQTLQPFIYFLIYTITHKKVIYDSETYVESRYGMYKTNISWNPLARAEACGTAGILRNRSSSNCALITPPPVIVACYPVAFPCPKDPAGRFLKCLYLGGPELLIPAGLVGAVTDTELGVILDRIGNGDGPLANNGIGGALVTAGGIHIAVFGGSDAGVPFEVTVIVEGGEVSAGEGTSWVTGAPGGILFVCLCQFVDVVQKDDSQRQEVVGVKKGYEP